jgi:hypothetical protein
MVRQAVGAITAAAESKFRFAQLPGLLASSPQVKTAGHIVGVHSNHPALAERLFRG